LRVFFLRNPTADAFSAGNCGDDSSAKEKSGYELSLPTPLLIANKKMKIYSSANIAVSPVLVACASLSK
jgi:hypothetical protein